MTVSIEQAQLSLKDLVERTTRGEKVVITQDHRPVAELVRASPDKPTPVFGSCRGMLHIVAEDDEHLKDFEEYVTS
jgi:antitoxin (DNA-binding transcriptional repressor) of toxin-antitoxin stability system